MKDRAFFTQAEPGWLHRFSQIGAAFLAASAAVVMLGWVFDAQVLIRILPNMVAMNPVAAVAFICLGLALREKTASGSRGRDSKKILAYGLAAIVACIGAMKLAQCAGCWTGRRLHRSRVG